MDLLFDQIDHSTTRHPFNILEIFSLHDDPFQNFFLLGTFRLETKTLDQSNINHDSASSTLRRDINSSSTRYEIQFNTKKCLDIKMNSRTFFLRNARISIALRRRRNVISILLTRSHLRFTENEEIIQSMCAFSPNNNLH